MGTKLKVPSGVTACSFGGVQYDPDKHGVIDVESQDAVRHFTSKPFNFQVATIDDEDDEPEADSFEGMTKSELVDWLVERDVEIPKGKLKKSTLVEMCADWLAENGDGEEDDGEDSEETSDEE